MGELCNSSLGQVKEQSDTIIDYIDISSLVSTVRPNLNAVAVYEEETINKTVVSTGFCVLDCKDDETQILFDSLMQKYFG